MFPERARPLKVLERKMRKVAFEPIRRTLVTVSVSSRYRADSDRSYKGVCREAYMNKGGTA